MRGSTRVVIVFSSIWLLGAGYGWLYPALQLAPSYTSMTDAEAAQAYHFLKQELEKGALRSDIARIFEQSEAAGVYRSVQYNYVRIDGTDIIVPFELTASKVDIDRVMRPLVQDFQKRHQRQALQRTLVPPLAAFVGLGLMVWIHRGFKRSKPLREPDSGLGTGADKLP